MDPCKFIVAFLSRYMRLRRQQVKGQDTKTPHVLCAKMRKFEMIAQKVTKTWTAARKVFYRARG